MSDYEIVRLKPEEYAKCNNIWDMSKQPGAQKWYDQLVNGNRIIFIYTVNGEFIGEGALVLDTGDADYTIENKRIYLSRMIVKSGYRNQGIGGIILDYLIQYAIKLGFMEMSVGVDIDNSNARHLYEKKGFTTIIFEGEDKDGKYVKLIKQLL